MNSSSNTDSVRNSSFLHKKARSALSPIQLFTQRVQGPFFRDESGRNVKLEAHHYVYMYKYGVNL